MLSRKFLHLLFSIIVIASLSFGGIIQANAQDPTPPPPGDPIGPYHVEGKVGNEHRAAAAERNSELGLLPGVAGQDPETISANMMMETPHYFGPYPNYANSKMPTGAIDSIVVDDPGSGYTTIPTVTIEDAYGTATTAAEAVVDGIDQFGGITGITVTAPGAGYTAPVVVIEGDGADAAASAVLDVTTLAGGIRKFVDELPGLTPDGENLLGQYIPVGEADTTTYPANAAWPKGSEYYEIGLVQYAEQLHSDLDPTLLRGYVQIATDVVPGAHVPLVNVLGFDENNNEITAPVLDANGNQVYGVDEPHYLGPLILAKRGTPVRIKFTNYLPVEGEGDLFLPVDATVMGAGMGPAMGGMEEMDPEHPMCNMIPKPEDCYSENRATLHLHGGFVPWISDGTPHQWTTPAGEGTMYPKGVSVEYVPDMWYVDGEVVPNTVGVTAPPVAGASTNPGDGSLTFYYNNDQSARLMFYHDHSYGITRLNVYAGEAAGYLIMDELENDLIKGTNNSGFNPGLVQVLPDVGIPLIIQDKTFVDPTTIPAQDPTWRWGATPGMTHDSDLWLPSVYMPAQNPWDLSGASAFGRWQYGPWFWPPTSAIMNPPVPNEYYDPDCDSTVQFCEPPFRPSVPTPSMGMEAFMDTPLVNGTVYPYMEVDPTTVRFRILDAANDRFVNLHFYTAVDADGVLCDAANTNPAAEVTGVACTEVKMVPAVKTAGYPSKWSTDGREGGVPDPFTMGPDWIQIGSEGGFLPAPVVIKPQPINWNMNATAFNVGNVTDHSLLLGPAERADVLVDFSDYAGQTLILYNDAPAAFPALDPRYDYYTGAVNQVDTGGAPTTQAGFGPNIRTIMQIRVRSVADALETPVALDMAALNGVFAKSDTNPGVFASTQDEPIIRQAAYGSAYKQKYAGDASVYVKQQDWTFNFFNGPLTSLVLHTPGTGYTSAPSVEITGGTGTNAAGTTTISGANIGSVTVTNGGSGYTSPPAVTFTGGGAAVTQAATGIATITRSVTGVNVTNRGSGYTSAPSVSFVGGGGSGATATASITRVVGQVVVTNGGSNYTSAPTVTITGGGGTGATAIANVSNFTRRVTSITITNGGSGYTSNPTVTITGGGGSGATASAVTTGVVTGVTVTNGGTGYTSNPSVRFNGGGGFGASATAQSSGKVSSITLTNQGAGYSQNPTVVFTGGNGSGAAATAAYVPGKVASITLTNPGTGYVSMPKVTLTGGGGTGATASAKGIEIALEPKAIHDEMGAAYDEYGRMSGFLGLELPVVNSLNQNMVLYGYANPPVDIMRESLTPLGTLADGTQIWKITHNGVDTHPIHFHLFNVQLINRVAWDGALLPPEPNELGWKETVRVNPLEHTIVAMRPVAPKQPWDIPNSVRPIDPTMPLDTPLMGGPGGTLDTTGVRVPLLNKVINFGWEYVWHCHILSHEEMDMMHSLSFAVAPKAPSNLTAQYISTGARRVVLTWKDNALNETGFIVQRATSINGPWQTRSSSIGEAEGTGNTITFSDTLVARNVTYFYRVLATNLVGDPTIYTAPAVGFPTERINSDPSNPGVSITTTTGSVGTPTIFASSFDQGLAGWSGVVGNVQAAVQAAMGPNEGGQGMVANLAPVGVQPQEASAPDPAYVFDTSPEGETAYNAQFIFDPNSAVVDSPVDIFSGIQFASDTEQASPTFGVQFQAEEDEYEIRGWAMIDGEALFTEWMEINNGAHNVEVAWLSGEAGGFTLYVDELLAGTLNGNTSAYTLDQVTLGATHGLSAGDSGALFFDEFISNRSGEITKFFTIFMPIVH